MFYTKKDSSIVSTDGLLAAMEMASANKRAGFIAVGNYHSLPCSYPTLRRAPGPPLLDGFLAAR
jgi:hypothetical protein